MYIAIWDDRHSDTTAHLFTGKQAVINWARKSAKKVCFYDELDWDEAWEDAPLTRTSRPLTTAALKNGFVYFLNYSCEGDSISVMEVEPDAELK